MQPAPRLRPTDAQLAILSVLWDHGPSTVRQVHEALPDDVRRGYTTTLKLMQIMVEQGLARRDESERSHVYAACVGEDETKGRLVDDLMQKAFGGSAAQLVMRALSETPASAAELAEIRALLARIEGKGDEA
ncbi:MAG: BlaI/MecI/CopY family transcriptional regulator [Planctomycetes bacterium]|nr:BlaI/MecI/CopY family transcriptional regulator [Planctomycetota bacterium]